MADETRQIQVLLGPYRDHRLTVSAADADAAINAHWAVDPFAPLPGPDEEPHPPLSEEERAAAFEAAETWAKAQWDTAQGEGKPKDAPDEGAARREPKPAERPVIQRDLKPTDKPTEGYTTRKRES